MTEELDKLSSDIVVGAVGIEATRDQVANKRADIDLNTRNKHAFQSNSVILGVTSTVGVLSRTRVISGGSKATKSLENIGLEKLETNDKANRVSITSNDSDVLDTTSRF